MYVDIENHFLGIFKLNILEKIDIATWFCIHINISFPPFYVIYLVWYIQLFCVAIQWWNMSTIKHHIRRKDGGEVVLSWWSWKIETMDEWQSIYFKLMIVICWNKIRGDGNASIIMRVEQDELLSYSLVNKSHVFTLTFSWHPNFYLLPNCYALTSSTQSYCFVFYFKCNSKVCKTTLAPLT